MPDESPVITLLTDFGTADTYVAQMKGVILQKCRSARLIDVTHEIPPQNIVRGAYALGDAFPSFPRGTIHVAVVDPGVGSERRILCAVAARQFFLGPDNGVLEFAFRDTRLETVVSVANEWYFSERVSTTFHGRDIFAPVAAHLALGVKATRLGPAVSDPVRLELPEVTIYTSRVGGAVIYSDRFGNLVTNIERQHLARVFQGAKSSQMLIRVAGIEIRGLSRSYSDQEPGTLLCLLGSSGRLEISVVRGSAVDALEPEQFAPVEALKS